jgi:hypothetical protein
VRGRSTGQPRRTPVNLLTLESQEYLVAPRGETQWVRNVRADQGRLTLILGRRRGARVATELADADKILVLRTYLKHWQSETGKFFGGVTAEASDEQLAAIAPEHPVFRLNPAE